MHFVRMYFIKYYKSATCIRRIYDHYQGVLKDTNKTYNKLLIYTV